MLGRQVRDEIYRILRDARIADIDVSERFEDVGKALATVFGEGSRLIMHKTIIELYRQYSQSVDPSHPDGWRDHLNFLRDRVVSDHLYPKRVEWSFLSTFYDK